MANNASLQGFNINASTLVGDTSPQLGGNLDLNSNNIQGTGSININGTITGQAITSNNSVTASTFSGSGASLTNLPAAQLTGALPAIDGSSLTGINTDLVADTTPQLGGNLDMNGNDVTGTNVSVDLGGTSNIDVGNLRITQNGYAVNEINTTSAGGSGTHIYVTTGTNGDFLVKNDSWMTGNTQLRCVYDDAVQLYFNGVKKLETATGGVDITGNLTTTGTITPGTYRTGEVIEELHAVCNGTDLHGRATIQNVTGSSLIGQSYGDATGSVVTSYTPPSGTKMIVYEYTAHLTWRDAHAISHWRLYYQVSGGTWTEVTKARTNRNGYYPEDKQILRWVFEVDATSDDSTLGKFNAATPQLGFKWRTRDYGSSNERGYLHLTQYWDGGGTDQYSQPMIMIKAIA